MYTLLEIYRHELESLFLLALKGRLKMVRGTGTHARGEKWPICHFWPQILQIIKHCQLFSMLLLINTCPLYHNSIGMIMETFFLWPLVVEWKWHKWKKSWNFYESGRIFHFWPHFFHKIKHCRPFVMLLLKNICTVH